MNQEIFIILGLSVLAFLIGSRLKKTFGKSHGRANKSKKQIKLKSQKQNKLKKTFTIAMLILVFSLLLFMIPALSRDILRSNNEYSENLVLRILIVFFSAYILFMGYSKIHRNKK